MRYALLAVPVIAGGMSFALPLTRSRPAPRLSHAPAEVVPTSCHGAAEYPLELEVTPTQIFSTTGLRGESVELGLDVGHKLGHGVRLIYALEVADDRGNVVVPRTLSRVESVAADGRTSYTLRVPTLGKDGFYVVRISVAGKNAAGQADERVVETYWELASGRLFQHDYADWFKLSNASKAVKL